MSVIIPIPSSVGAKAKHPLQVARERADGQDICTGFGVWHLGLNPAIFGTTHNSCRKQDRHPTCSLAWSSREEPRSSFT